MRIKTFSLGLIVSGESYPQVIRGSASFAYAGLYHQRIARTKKKKKKKKIDLCKQPMRQGVHGTLKIKDETQTREIFERQIHVSPRNHSYPQFSHYFLEENKNM